MKQGSEEWLQARCGRITASRIADLTAETKSGYAASRKNYLAELLVERMTGVPTDGFTSTAMQWGTDHEPEARAVYEFETDNSVEEVGFVQHPKLEYAGASPDGYVGVDGMVEIKCPNTATHIETLQSKNVPSRYLKQIQWQLECADREWCDFVSYDPRMKDPRLVLFIQRVERDDILLTGILIEVEKAEAELKALVEKITEIADER